MSISFTKDWEFDTLDYSQYNHIINQEKIVWFATAHNFSSEYNTSNQTLLHFSSFCSKRIELNGQSIIAVLIYCGYIKDSQNYYLEIFTDSDKNWKVFSKIFEFLIAPDLECNEALRYMSSFINQMR